MIFALPRGYGHYTPDLTSRAGAGQNEIDFKYSDALEAADNLVTFRSVVKTIAARNGLYASFMPKPLDYASGNGFILIFRF